MAIRLLDLQLLYGVAGAREHFEHVCADLIRAEFSGAKEARCQSGDGGVDVYIGDWADPEGISVFQVKYFPLGLGSSQKDQVRRSFRTCIENDHFTVSHWTLCLPIDLSEEETAWFTKWKHQQATNFLSVDNIDWWGESALCQFLLQPKNVGIKEAYFHQEHFAQIREMYRMLTHLLEDFATRPEESVMVLALRQDAKDANLRYRNEVYGPLHTELKRIRDVLERAYARTGPYPLRIPVGGEQQPRYPRYTPPASFNTAVEEARKAAAPLLSAHVAQAIEAETQLPDYLEWKRTYKDTPTLPPYRSSPWFELLEHLTSPSSLIAPLVSACSHTGDARARRGNRVSASQAGARAVVSPCCLYGDVSPECPYHYPA